MFFDGEVYRLGEERMRHEGLPAGPFLSFNFQHVEDDISNLRVEVGLKLDLLRVDVVLQIIDVVAPPWSSGVKHLIKDDTHTPNVAFIGKVRGRKYLWSGIEGGS